MSVFLSAGEHPLSEMKATVNHQWLISVDSQPGTHTNHSDSRLRYKETDSTVILTIRLHCLFSTCVPSEGGAKGNRKGEAEKNKGRDIEEK